MTFKIFQCRKYFFTEPEEASQHQPLHMPNMGGIQVVSVLSLIINGSCLMQDPG